MAIYIRRRGFITLLCDAAASPRARAHSSRRMGYFHPTMLAAGADLVAAFRKGLSETGYVEGRNVTIEYAWARMIARFDLWSGSRPALNSKQVFAIIGNPHLPRRGGSPWVAKDKTDGVGESFCEVPLWPARRSFSV
jgi:hypothetical protein